MRSIFRGWKSIGLWGVKMNEQRSAGTAVWWSEQGTGVN